MFYKEQIGNELYIYCNGSLLMKKWIGTKQSSVIFDVMAYRKNDVLKSIK